MKKFLKTVSISTLTVLMLMIFTFPVSALEEDNYPEYQVTENQLQLIERGYSIDQVIEMSEEQVSSSLRSRSSGYVDSTTSEVPNSRVYFTKKDVGLHPEFPNYKYASGYYFSNSSNKLTMSVSLGISNGRTASFGVSISRAGSTSGWYVAADSSRASRPMMFITGYTKRLKVVETDRYTGDYLRTYYLNVPIIKAEGARPYYM